jgi:hypothetical protein
VKPVPPGTPTKSVVKPALPPSGAQKVTPPPNVKPAIPPGFGRARSKSGIEP